MPCERLHTSARALGPRAFRIALVHYSVNMYSMYSILLRDAAPTTAATAKQMYDKTASVITRESLFTS